MWFPLSEGPETSLLSFPAEEIWHKLGHSNFVYFKIKSFVCLVTTILILNLGFNSYGHLDLALVCFKAVYKKNL